MAGRGSRVYLPFLLFNLGLVLAIGAVWLWPLLSSLSHTREVQRLQESRYALYSRYQEQDQDHGHYAANAALLGRADANERLLLPYDKLTDALADINRLGDVFGLNGVALSASEPVAYDKIFEMRVAAEYEGASGAVPAFILALDGGAAYIRELRIGFMEGGKASVRIDFSLVGIKGVE
jgi:hypothetical protein